ncbi:UDP-Glycosyltransferase/glycogen phosphorylase [Mycena crocata]|nr:UDP-Glycosyltransferase/glycogen phosphorylase [Mycena crocata]
MPGQNIRHLLLVPLSAYGHIRPMSALAGRLAAEPDVVVTVLIAPNWVEKAHADQAAFFPEGHEAHQRIRILSMFESTARDADFLGYLRPMSVKHYPIAYETLFRGESIKCATTGKIYPAVPPPTAVILDRYGVADLRSTRAISGTTVPVFTFASFNAASIIRLYGPESLGGVGDIGAKMDAEALRTGRDAGEIGDEMWERTDGTVLNIPGIRPMYDYEVFPQELILPPGVYRTPLLREAHSMFLECDGAFLGTSPAYEGDGKTLAALEGWFTQTLHKPVYTVGPVLPPGYFSQKTDTALAPRDAEVVAFLDSKRGQFGDKSVLLITFGSIFFPMVPAHVEELMTALFERQFPFILCIASPYAKLPEELEQKIKASGLGLTMRWCPQRLILSHPATGWFMTHAGHGGIMESLTSGVPMICWPFDGDQPFAAEHLSQTLNVAFHLIEVRTGRGLKPLRNGRVPKGTREAMGIEIREVFDQARGRLGTQSGRMHCA